MIDLFNELAESIATAASGRKIIYIPNPGNFGDGLIRYGTKQLFLDHQIVHDELNVRYSHVKFQLTPYLLKNKNYYFVYGGGGAWSEAYGFAKNTVKYIDRFTSDYTVLPSTYALAGIPSKGRLYRRDQGDSIKFSPSSIFCHDMALYSACRPGSKASYPAPTKGAGICMRTDHESRFAGQAVPANNVDLSIVGDHMCNGDDLLKMVAEYDHITTDRLHICIAACIVGRPVDLITGSYFKIKAIYESSIKVMFGDQVRIVESPRG